MEELIAQMIGLILIIGFPYIVYSKYLGVKKLEQEESASLHTVSFNKHFLFKYSWIGIFGVYIGFALLFKDSEITNTFIIFFTEIIPGFFSSLISKE